jgi:OmcA/MtrC family decaheme c-type cytochrome
MRPPAAPSLLVTHASRCGLLLLAAIALAACEGPAGPPGTTGPSGDPGANGAKGDTGDRGSKGTSGTPGADGSKGDPGAKGDTGEPGAPGDPATTPDPRTGPTGPGLHVKLRGVSVEGRQVVVSLVAVDDFGTGIDARVETLALRFTLALAPADGSAYRNLVTRTETAGTASALQPSTDSGGVLTQATPGVYTYSFKTQLPDGFDAAATYVVAGWGDRTSLTGERYVDNFVVPFVPAGGAAGPLRQEITDAGCNACHLQLEAHGGARRSVALCTTCHSVGFGDAQSGNDIGFPVMIHAIHRGENLPSVKGGMPYQIIGFQGAVNDFSDVAFPQDLRNCQTCHVPAAAQSDVWKTKPGKAACLSCHDRTWMKKDVPPPGYTAHPFGVTDDLDCNACHGPNGTYASEKVHALPENDPASPTLRLSLRSVTGVAPGGTPVVKFTAKDAAGAPLDLAALPSGVTVNRIAVTIAGPTTAYRSVFTSTMKGSGAVGTTVADATPGDYTWTAATALPADLAGTYGVALEGRLAKAGVNFASPNPITYVAVTDTTPVKPQLAASVAQCNACHQQLNLHGGLRHDVEYCVMCHNPSATDIARRPAAELPAQSIDLRVLVHAIHGAELREKPFVVYGFGNAKNDFSGVRFPAGASRCDACHVSLDATGLEEGEPANVVKDAAGAVVRSTPAGAAVCSSCHDSEGAQVHMELNTVGLGSDAREACTVCHDADAEFAPAHVHGLK